MHLKDPLKIYTAESNIEAHLIVEMLQSNGIKAFAEEDLSTVTLWAFGRISQIHQPNVWIERSSESAATKLIDAFEERKQERASASEADAQIVVLCEDCGQQSFFAKKLYGTVQDCPYCSAYVDVGELDWEDDFGEPEEEDEEEEED
jgi:hypothetical protein